MKIRPYLAAFALLLSLVAAPGLATIDDNAPRNAYTATAGQTAFTYSFEILANTDLKVLQNGTLLALSTDYTVSGVGTQSGGTVTLVSGATNGDTVIVYRDMPVSRTTDYQPGGKLNPDTLDLDVDRVVLGVQQVERDVDRTIKMPVTDTTAVVDMALPSASTRASKFLAFDSLGKVTVSSGTTASTISAGLTSLLDTGGFYASSDVENAFAEIASLQRSFGTVTLLKAATARFDGEVVYLTCYYTCTTPDGGGGSFRYDAASTASDNGGTILDPDSSGAGRWERIYSGALNIRWFGAKGDNATDDTAKIQATITAAGTYGSVFAPCGNYIVASTIAITVPISLSGAGFCSQFIVSDAMSVSADVFTVTPTSVTGAYYLFRDFAVTPRSIVGGRHAFYLDSTNKAIKDSLFSNLHLYELNGSAIVAVGTGVGEGSIVATTIENSTLGGGIEIATCGDAVRITGNHIYGTPEALDVSFQAGASTMVFGKNVVTNDGGVKVRTLATTLQIISNEFETNSTFTGSNGALIDIDGAGGGVSNDTIIAYNSFQVVNSITTDTIRVNFGTRTHIFGNRMGRGITTSNDVIVTANAIDTMIGPNTWPSTTPVLSDAGTRTTFFSQVNGEWLSKQYINLASSSGAVDGERIRLGRTDDANRYSSIYALGASGGTATVSVRVHDGVGAQTQSTAVVMKANSAGGFTQVPMGLSGSLATVPSIANRNTTAVGNVGGGEDALIQYSLPLNSLSAATRGVRITAWGTTANNSNPKTAKLYFGSGAVVTTALTVSQAGTWRITGEVLSTGTDTQDYSAQLLQGGATTLLDVENGSLTEDDGAAILIRGTGTVTDGGGGINNDDIVQEGMMVEVLN